MENYKICKKCIMNTTDPEIAFDENGVCNHCLNYQKNLKYLYSEEELKKEIEKIKEAGRGKKYDCIIGLSGGRDSSTVAYWVKKMGLRPLAFHLDNGWDTEISVKNIENIVRALHLDLYTYIINWEEFKDLQLSFLRASVSNIEIPTDHAIMALMYKMATKYNVKYLIIGGNVASEGIMPETWSYASGDLKHLKAIHKKFGKIPLKTFPTKGIWYLAYYVLVKKIKRFRILDYVNYNKKESEELLKREFGWRDYGGKHHESIFTRFFQGYILPKKFGIDKRRAHLSSLINSGQITREEALKEMEKNPYLSEEMLKEDKEYVIKKLGLTEQEFEDIMALPIKKHSDYPNNSLLLNWLTFIYAVFVKKLLAK